MYRWLYVLVLLSSIPCAEAQAPAAVRKPAAAAILSKQSQACLGCHEYQ
jgi:cytochrome c553